VIDGNDVLNALGLPALTTTGTFTVTDNPDLSTCDAHAIAAQLDPAPTTTTIAGNGLDTIVGDLIVDAASPLTPADLLCIGAVTGNLTITGVGWATLDLPNLGNVGGTLTIAGNPNATAINLPALTSAGGIVIDGNDVLNTLGLPALTTTGTFTVTDNPDLSTCDAYAIATQLDPAPTTTTIAGNGLDTIVGDLIVDAASPITPADLLCIGAVTGNLTITGVGWTTLDLPNLGNVGGTLTIAGNANATAINLPALTTAGGIVIDGNDVLNALGLPALDTTGTFTVTDNPSLSTCDVQAILGLLTPAPTTTTISGNGLDTYVGDLLIDAASPLTPADLQCYEAITGDLTITGVGWTTLDLPNLVAVGGTLTVANDTGLTALDLPALGTTDGIDIDGNAALTSLDLTALTTADPFIVTNNPSLSSCGLEALVAQLDPTPTTVDLTGNLDCADPGATCTLEPLDVIGDVEVDATGITLDDGVSPAPLTRDELLCLRSIDGDLMILGSSETTLALPILESVSGLVGVGENTSLQMVRLPALTTTTAVYVQDNPALLRLELPMLDGGPANPLALHVVENPSLADVRLDSLTHARSINFQNLNEGGDLATAPPLDLSGLVATTEVFIVAYSTLTELDLSALTTVGTSFIVGANTLGTLVVPSLQQVGQSTSIGSNEALATIHLPALTSTRVLAFENNKALTDLAVDILVGTDALSVRVDENAALSSAAFPALAAAKDLLVYENPELATLDLGSLARVEIHLQLYDNPKLSTCDIFAILDHVTVEFFSIYGNRTETITGDLVIDGGTPPYDLRCIGRVEGDVRIVEPASGAFDLHSLASITGSLALAAPAMTDILVPELTTVGGDLDIADCNVDGLHFLTLVNVGGALDVQSNDGLGVIELPELASVGSIRVADNLELNFVRLYTLEGDAGVVIDVARNPALRELTTPALASVEALRVSDNPTMSTCDLRALADQITSPNATIIIARNKQDCADYTLLPPACPNGPETVASLTIDAANPAPANLGCIQTITGAFVVSGSDLTGLELPLLASVGSLTVLANEALTALALPSLTNAGTIEIAGNDLLATVDLGALPGGPTFELEVATNAALTTLTLTALDEVARLHVLTNPQLSTCALRELLVQLGVTIPGPAIDIVFSGNLGDCGDYDGNAPCPDGTRTVDNLTIDSLNPAPADLHCIAAITGALIVDGSDLTTLELPLLTSAGSISVLDNTSLTTIGLPSLNGTGTLDILIEGNAALATLDLAALSQVASMYVLDNPVLSTCALLALLPQLGVTGPGSDIVFSGNFADCGDYDGNDPCPAGTTVHEGNLIIGATPPEPGSLTCIATINGSLILEGATLTELDMPVLTTITGSFNVVNCESLAVLSLPSLQSVQALYISNNDALTTLQLDALVGYWTVPNSVPGLSFIVVGNDSLHTLGFASLDIVYHFNVSGNASLAMCDVYTFYEGLTQVSYVTILNNLAEAGCPNLEQ
ncbi:MAG: hypothetical protein IT385_29725, partial [Deltaproteobacteria bacterium]|nr:hypothetical protein [Deltaproteobacteria bacterium]